MRAFQIIVVAPAVKVVLAGGQIGKGPLVQQFGFEGAMEAFVFAQGLGVRGPGMTEGNAQADEPDGQGREGAEGERDAPRGAIIHQHAVGQAIAPEGLRQVRLDRRALFIGTGMETEGEAGAVVQHGQGVAPAGGHGEMAFEIHLPQGIGGGVLEALPRPLGGSRDGGEPGGAAENRGDGARRGYGGIAQSLETGVQFAAAPRGVLGAQLQDRRFERGGGALGHLVRAAGVIGEARAACRRIAGQPFIGGGGADLEPATEGAEGDPRLLG